MRNNENIITWLKFEINVFKSDIKAYKSNKLTPPKRMYTELEINKKIIKLLEKKQKIEDSRVKVRS
jgi:hypothetical protein